MLGLFGPLATSGAATSTGSGIGQGLLQLGSRLFGGILGSRSNKRAARERERDRRQAQAQFDAQMDQSIQRRVADAQKAGVHPLAALGSNVGSSPTLSSSAQPAPTGSAIGDAISELAGDLGVIAKNRSEARLDEAQAAYYDALTAKAKSDSNSVGRDIVGGASSGEPLAANRPGNEGPAVEVLPRQVTPSRADDPARIVGSVPTLDTIVMPDGRELQVPNREYFEELGEWEAARRIITLYGTDKIESIIAAIRNQKDVHLARIWERAYRAYMSRSRYSRRLERDRNRHRRQGLDMMRLFRP